MLSSISISTSSWGRGLLSYMSRPRRRSSTGQPNESLPLSANSAAPVAKIPWARKRSNETSLWSSSSIAANEVITVPPSTEKTNQDNSSPKSKNSPSIVQMQHNEKDDVYPVEVVRNLGVTTHRDDIETGPGFIGTRKGSLIS